MKDERELDDYDKMEMTEEGQKWKEARDSYFLSELLWRIIPPAIAFFFAAGFGWYLFKVTPEDAKAKEQARQDQAKNEFSDPTYEETDTITTRDGAELEIERKTRK